MRLAASVALAVALAADLPQGRAAQDRPTFKAGVDRVAVTAVVRTRDGQPVTHLTREDFEILDNGRPRPILEFRAEPTPATIALLADFSGSMHHSSKLLAARSAAAQVLTRLTPGVDRVGLFAFDVRLHELHPFRPAPGEVLQKFDALRPFGATSLFDAIAESGRRLADDGSIRRAVVALTDGGENSSRLTVAQVTRLASEVDVPVYIIVVVSPLDRDASSRADLRAEADSLSSSPLGNLSHWTGGEIFLASSDRVAAQAADQIVDELRHQYFIGFAPDPSRPGWHPIVVRTRQKDLVVRARSGYVAANRLVSQW